MYEALAGLILSHVFHLLSVLLLYDLSLLVTFLSKTANHPRIHPRMALLTSLLHILTPAGIFLSAPYAESPFAFLNFAGIYLYSKSQYHQSRAQILEGEICIVLSGIMFGLATTLRGNGLLSGLILVFDAVAVIISALQSMDLSSHTRRLFAICLSGASMAFVAFIPQYIAYRQYCTLQHEEQRLRPWCSYWFPSIYAWVQKEYWYVRWDAFRTGRPC